MLFAGPWKSWPEAGNSIFGRNMTPDTNLDAKFGFSVQTQESLQNDVVFIKQILVRTKRDHRSPGRHLRIKLLSKICRRTKISASDSDAASNSGLDRSDQCKKNVT